MAYINVAEWTPDQVTDWLKGLDDSMGNYVNSFTNNEVGGRQLLNIRPYELEQLGMYSIGHQEIVLEAVENLRNFHYNLDKENLQFMALHVATAAHCLCRQLTTYCDSTATTIETRILNDITRTIGTIKPLIGWLGRAPFQGHLQFTEICRNMLRYGVEMATIAQRDRFVERPVEEICKTAEKLERLANYIIQDISDPMLLQPASLNLVTVKKRDPDPGFEIEPNYHGIHRISDIKYNSPAHNSGKIEAGDEIVQINYQTVVGWQAKTVWDQLHLSSPDVLLTLKKRPKHTKIYGQIYVQPYRLPSKKRTTGTRWGENVPNPRFGYLTVPTAAAAFDLSLSLKSEEKTTATASDSDSSENLTPTDTKVSERLYYEKPRAVLQRRHTICGDIMSSSEVLQRHKPQASIVGDPASPSLRDKSKSFGYGLELASRPKTCIELGSNAIKSDDDVAVGQGHGHGQTVHSKGEAATTLEASKCQDRDSNLTDKSKPDVCKVVRFDAAMKSEDYPIDEKYICNVDDTILETFEPIPFVDEGDEDAFELQRNEESLTTGTVTVAARKLEREQDKNKEESVVEAINVPVIARRGRLDKSHSTPAYDNTGNDCDTPPAIEPRKEFMLLTPPVPPPRPRKQKDIIPPPVPPPPPLKLLGLQTQALTADAEINASKSSTSSVEAKRTPLYGPPASAPESGNGTSEPLTPSKGRTLTLKKKHSLIAKRRNVNLKVLGIGDIQGHLYRRTKDRRGVTFWARLYFVMLDTNLYGFRSKEALKASCVIFLPGFTVSLAKEVHSKPYAFKVYHAAKAFYFAAESQDALNQWVEMLRHATIQSHPTHGILHSLNSTAEDINTKELFSETDSSGEESESMVAKNLCTPSPRGTQDGATTGLGMSPMTPVASSTKNERRYLAFILAFKGTSTSSEKKPSSDIPVPTEQYRSYRKVPGGSFGIQIGTNTPGYHADVPFQAPPNTTALKQTESSSSSQRKLSLSSSRCSIVSNGVADCSSFEGPPSSPAPTPNPVGVVQRIENATPSGSNKPLAYSTLGKPIKKIPYNFIHASNPNLVEFDFQTSKTLDNSLPKINPANSWDSQHNIQNFITLKDLMLKKQKEEAQDMYTHRVNLGMERKDERNPNSHGFMHPGAQAHAPTGDSNASLTSNSNNKLSKTQSRSLPKTPDYEISFKPDDEDIKRTRTKEGQKLRDFGYELIYGEEPSNSSSSQQHNMQNRMGTISDQHTQMEQNSKLRPFPLLSNKHKKHSSNSCSSTLSAADLAGGEKRPGSFKKKSKSERIFQQFGKHMAGGSSTGITMTLPLNKKSAGSGGGNGIKKSHTYNNDLKEKGNVKYEAHRKNSAPMPIFTKLSTTFGGASNQATCSKEKKILGSPLLHRTIFGSHHQSQEQLQHSTPLTPTCTGREYDREIFSQVIFPKVSSHTCKLRSQAATPVSNSAITAPDTLAPPPPLPPHDRESPREPKDNYAGPTAATPEYPHIECPPVFEAEIYSLSDSNANQTLLLRRKNSGSNGIEEK